MYITHKGIPVEKQAEMYYNFNYPSMQKATPQNSDCVKFKGGIKSRGTRGAAVWRPVVKLRIVYRWQ